jgi:hypothetical protein
MNSCSLAADKTGHIQHSRSRLGTLTGVNQVVYLCAVSTGYRCIDHIIQVLTFERGAGSLDSGGRLKEVAVSGLVSGGRVKGLGGDIWTADSEAGVEVVDDSGEETLAVWTSSISAGTILTWLASSDISTLAFL